MPNEVEVGPASELTPGTVTGAGRYAVGNAEGELFAVTRRCRHLYADLANGSIDEDGCLVCPWHGSKYDVETGRMVRGPQGCHCQDPWPRHRLQSPHLGAAARAGPGGRTRRRPLRRVNAVSEPGQSSSRFQRSGASQSRQRLGPVSSTGRPLLRVQSTTRGRLRQRHRVGTTAS